MERLTSNKEMSIRLSGPSVERCSKSRFIGSDWLDTLDNYSVHQKPSLFPEGQILLPL